MIEALVYLAIVCGSVVCAYLLGYADGRQREREEGTAP